MLKCAGNLLIITYICLRLFVVTNLFISRSVLKFVNNLINLALWKETECVKLFPIQVFCAKDHNLNK